MCIILQHLTYELSVNCKDKFYFSQFPSDDWLYEHDKSKDLQVQRGNHLKLFKAYSTKTFFFLLHRSNSNWQRQSSTAWPRVICRANPSSSRINSVASVLSRVPTSLSGQCCACLQLCSTPSAMHSTMGPWPGTTWLSTSARSDQRRWFTAFFSAL